jgi:hypothetical protein
LLKLLSRVTAPTTGEIKVRGRIASLLEVGTGFHPELTGRENIFLNGSILGMTKTEIKSKFDEIVDFTGVAKYIDTPVKRYSSGMLLQTTMKWNPLTYLIGGVRDSMIYGKIEHFDRFLISSAISLIFFLITWRLFYISEEKVIEKMI